MIYVIAGPTGSGKTDLALMFAKTTGAQIINADAFQVYRSFDIGTNKVSVSERGNIAHHLLDIVEPDGIYDVATYQLQARDIIDRLNTSHVPTVIVGGTGLYIKAALYDYKFPAEEETNNTQFLQLSDEALYQRLMEVDPVSATKIHAHNRRRVLRALAIYERTGIAKSEHLGDASPNICYDACFVGIDIPRDKLYAQVTTRVDDMVSRGLMEEAESLYNCFGGHIRAFQAIGYKQLVPYFEGRISKDAAIEAIKVATRHYIKRQYTFFHHQLPMKWFLDKHSAMTYLMKEYELHG